MENIGMVDNQELSTSESIVSRADKLHAHQKFEAFINSLAHIVAKYGDDVMVEIEKAA